MAINPITLYCPVRNGAINRPDAAAIYLENKQISYTQLDQLVSDISQQLTAQAVVAGDIVTCIDENSVELIIILFACLRTGAIFCPLNPKFPAQQKVLLLANTGANWLWQANSQCPINQDDTNAQLLTIQLPKVAPAQKSLKQISLNSHFPATAIFTSGSSGTPKAAVHSCANHYYSALGSQQCIPFGSDDCWLVNLPIFHIAGLSILFRAVFAGAAIALTNKKELQQVISELPITHASLVAAQLTKLLSPKPSPDEHGDLHQLKYLLIGGSAVSEDLLQKLTTTKLKAFYSYGLTEMASQVVTIPVTQRSFTKPLPHRQLAIEENEIKVGGETLFLGYLQYGQLTNPKVDGWFYTRDLAAQTNEGFIIAGRKDNMFISGGENCQPEAIEAVIREVNGIDECLVVPVPDKRFGEVCGVFIKWKGCVKQKALLTHLAERLSPYQLPKYIFPWLQQPIAGIKLNRTWYKEQAIHLVNQEPAQHRVIA